MRTRKISGLILFGSVVAAVVIGCGGGGGGEGSSANPSTINEAGIKEVASYLVSNGMCTDKAGIVTSSSSISGGETSSDAVSSANDGISSSGSSSSINPFPATGREYEYDYSYPGVLGGEVNIHQKHANGTTSYSYDFSDFENYMGGGDVKLNGKGEKIDHGKPGDFGPIISNTTADTKGPIDAEVKDHNRAVGGTRHYEFELSGYDHVYTKTFGDPDKITIDSVSMTDTDANGAVRVKKVSMNGYISSTSATISDFKATYINPQNESIKVSQGSEPINVSMANTVLGIPSPTNISGAVELEGTDGTKGVLEVVGSSVKIYTKDTSGQKTLISDLDCSGLTEQQ